jgi:hypothetical protein
MFSMSSYFCEYAALVKPWPNPVLLAHEQGDIYLMFTDRKAYIEARWYGHINANDVITAARVYLELLKKTPNSKLLNDKTEANGDWMEANDWLEFEWVPQVIEGGLCCMAHVYSTNMFSKLSARDLYLRVIPDLHMENFLNRKDAINWLDTCKAASIDSTPSPFV